LPAARRQERRLPAAGRHLQRFGQVQPFETGRCAVGRGTLQQVVQVAAQEQGARRYRCAAQPAGQGSGTLARHPGSFADHLVRIRRVEHRTARPRVAEHKQQPLPAWAGTRTRAGRSREKGRHGGGK
jgi:hypothetical protein